MELADKVVVITGGASGIGKALAERAHADGAAHVVVVDRDDVGATAVAETVGGTAAVVDVTDEAAIAALVDATVLGGLAFCFELPFFFFKCGNLGLQLGEACLNFCELRAEPSNIGFKGCNDISVETLGAITLQRPAPLINDAG